MLSARKGSSSILTRTEVWAADTYKVWVEFRGRRYRLPTRTPDRGRTSDSLAHLPSAARSFPQMPHPHHAEPSQHATSPPGGPTAKCP